MVGMTTSAKSYKNGIVSMVSVLYFVWEAEIIAAHVIEVLWWGVLK